MLYGREVESDRLAALLAEAAAGRGGALVVRGEPGVGKTALLRNAVSRTDALVLWTQGLESESPLAFAALHRLLRPVLGQVDRLPASQADALLVALGARDGSQADRFGVFVATLSLLTEAAGTRPVVVVVDDAQWLDSVSAEALLFVARRLQSDRVAVIFGARDGDVRRFDGAGLDDLTIAGLDEGAAAALLMERAGSMVSTEVRDALLAHTGGNPLALLEIPTVLSPPQLTGADLLPALLPLTEGVERTFLDRSRRLTPNAQTLLLVAAADDTGRVAIISRAAASLHVGDQALAELERSELVLVTQAELQFRHPLVRSAVYAAATLVERQQVHKALAATLRGSGEPDRGAWHLALATGGLDEDVALALDAVATRSERRGGHSAASAAWERAAVLSPAPEDKARRLLAAAGSAWVAGRPARARALADDARQLTSDPLLASDIERLRARLEWNVGSAAVGHRIVMTAAHDVAHVDPVRALEMAMLGTALATYGGDSGIAGAGSNSFLSALSGSASPRVRCLTGLLTGQQHVLADRMADAAVAFREAFAMVQLAGEDLDLRANTALGAFHLGDWQVTLRDFSWVLEVARAANDVSRMVFALSRLPLAHLPAGRWDAARAATDEALILGQATGQRALTALPLAWRALLAALRGGREGAGALADLDVLVAGPAVGIGVVAVTDIAHWARGINAATDNDFSTALRHLSRLQLPAMRRQAALDRLEAAVHAGYPEVAAEWCDDLERFGNETGADWAAAVACHGLALLSHGAAAEAHFERALALHERDVRPFAQARTQLAFGELLRRSGRRVDARAFLRSSLETLDDLGAAPWADRAMRELRASGESARRRDMSTLPELTPQEQQVVRLVTQGLSNREVAGRLFVSPRTVEYHLSHAYQKLGVRSRGQLAGLGLV